MYVDSLQLLSLVPHVQCQLDYTVDLLVGLVVKAVIEPRVGRSRRVRLNHWANERGRYIGRETYNYIASWIYRGTDANIGK